MFIEFLRIPLQIVVKVVFNDAVEKNGGDLSASTSVFSSQVDALADIWRFVCKYVCFFFSGRRVGRRVQKLTMRV